MYGKQISKVLVEIEEAMWANDCISVKPEYTDEALRASIKIFSSVVLDKMFSLMDKEEMDIETRNNMAAKCGEEIRHLVKVYTDIDTRDLYSIQAQ